MTEDTKGEGATPLQNNSSAKQATSYDELTHIDTSSSLINVAFNNNIKEINDNMFVNLVLDLYGNLTDSITMVGKRTPEANAHCPEYVELQRLYNIRERHPELNNFLTATMLYYYFKNVDRSDYPDVEQILVSTDTGKGVKESINHLSIAQFIIRKYCIITVKNRAFIFDNGYFQEDEGIIKADIQKILSMIPNTHTKTTDRITTDIYEKILKLSLVSNLVKSPFLKNSMIIPTKTEALLRCHDKIVHIPRSPAIGKNWYVNAEYVDDIDTTEVWNFLIDVTNKEGCYIQDYAKVIVQIGSSAISQKKYLQMSYMMYGSGSNGKTLISNMYNGVFGKNNVAHLKLQDFKNRFSLGTILGKVMNIYPEIPMNSLTSDACSAFKAINGDDELDFEKKFKDPITELTTIVMLFSANTLPDVPSDIDAEPAWWRRWTVINLPNYYEANPTIAERMTSPEIANQLFKLIVDDIPRLERDGLYKSQAMDTTRELWRCGANNVFRFFVTNYEVSPTELPREKWISKEAMYQHYKRFCDEMDISPDQTKSNVVFHPILAREKCKIKKTLNEATQKEERYYTNVIEKNVSNKVEQMGFGDLV